ncbi:MAG: rhodanese-like domain-containing protein [Candidatus Neomarinimicrobiota bacterium]
MRAGIIAIILMGIGAFVACQTRATIGKEPVYENITPARLKERLERGEDLVLLDVRSPREFTGPLGHLEGAILIPVRELEERVGELNDYKDKEIIAYCRSGNRSRTAATLLSRHSFRVTNLLGGMKAWNASMNAPAEDQKMD